MTRNWTFTSESVSEGHPDKMADQISDAVLDAMLEKDPESRVACETMITTGLVVVAGEVTTSEYVDIPKTVRETICEIGYDREDFGFDGHTCGVMVALDSQSSDIARGVDDSEEVRSGISGEEDELDRQGVVGVSGIDTRAVVRHLRSRGSMKAGVFSGAAAEAPVDELVDRVRHQEPMLGADLAGEVSTDDAYVVEPEGGERFTVVALDLGIKTNTPRMFAERGIRVHVVPSATSIEQVLELNPDGVFLSNGPGDPATADSNVALTRQVLERELPLFGICFGNQILGRALGRSTYKMKFGHRGMNIPVIEHATGRIAITAQNHGFALEGEAGEEFDSDFGRARISHTCANDGTVEGVELLGGSAFSVQYHPEAAAGPHDAAYLFDRFTSVLEGVDK